ncbi:MAG: amidase family protein, partial [Candidatus Tumulicola sp.]
MQRNELIERSAGDIARDVNAGTISASEVTEATLAQVDAVDSRVGAYLTVLHDLARERAAGVDARVRAGERLPLAGVPLAVKDNMC